MRPYSGLDALAELIRTVNLQSGGRSREYDCVMAFSGGRDSTYILHVLVEEMGLKPLAYFLDNGLVPRETHVNIRRFTEQLGVELAIETHERLTACLEHNLRAFLHRPSPATVGLLCSGCRLAMKERIPAFAERQGIPIVIYGSTPVDAYSFKLELLRRHRNGSGPMGLVTGYLREMAKNPGWLKSFRSLWTQAQEFRECFWRSRSGGNPGLLRIAPFDTCLQWVEKEVVETIRSRYGWRKNPGLVSTWRGDCRLAPLKGYVYRRLLGFNDTDVLVSYLVRDGQIDRAAALDRLAAEERYSDDILDEVLVPYGFCAGDLHRALDAVQPKIAW